MPRRRRPKTDDTNWDLRDNVSHYTDQAKAAPAAAKELASLPKTWFGAVKEMVDDLRSDGTPAHPDPKDPQDRPDGHAH